MSDELSRAASALRQALENNRRKRDLVLEDERDWKIQSQFLQGKVEGLEMALKIVEECNAKSG